MADLADLDALLRHDRYPRSAGYDATWVLANQMGPHPLWLTEWLAEEMDLQPGMRVLDMGCGKALSSIFLAREFGVRVWANDLWIPASENWERIREAGLEEQIVPIQAEAHALPYAHAFFDAAISIDSFHYYGTDNLYLNYFAQFIRPGGQIGVAVPGLMQPIAGEPPAHLTTPSAMARCFGRTSCGRSRQRRSGGGAGSIRRWWRSSGRTRSQTVATTGCASSERARRRMR